MSITDRDIEYIRARQIRARAQKKSEPMYTRMPIAEYDNSFGGFTSETNSRIVGVAKDFGRMTVKPVQHQYVRTQTFSTRPQTTYWDLNRNYF